MAAARAAQGTRNESAVIAGVVGAAVALTSPQLAEEVDIDAAQMAFRACKGVGGSGDASVEAQQEAAIFQAPTLNLTLTLALNPNPDRDPDRR